MKIGVHTVISTATAALLAAMPVAADDFDDFISSAKADFNSFIDDATRDFLDFMRSPWQEIKAQPPQQLRAQPELDAPLLYDPNPVASTKAPDKPNLITVPASEPSEKPSPAQPESTDADKVRELLAQNKPDDNTAVTSPSTVKPVTPQPSAPVPPAKSGKSNEPATTPSHNTPAEKTPVVKEDKTPAGKVTPATTPMADKAKAKSEDAAPATPENNKPETIAPKKQEVKQPAKVSNPLYDGGANRAEVEYCGRKYYVDASLKNAFKLSKLDEKNIADAHESLFKKNYAPLLDDLKTLRRDNLGNDWALFMTVRKLSESFVGKNESVVMRQFILNQLGYKTRIARKVSPQSLALYVATDKEIFQHPYIERGGLRYYDTDSKELYRFTMCDADAPAAKSPLSMALAKTPDMAESLVKSTRSASGNAVSVTMPRQLIDFYNDMPQCDYSVYINAPVDGSFSSALLSSLHAAIDGKSKHEGAGILLDFVQNGFEYATDQEQFGYEKPFFVEELFYYPQCDCEDRSILYRYLVKNLLGLDCILINYPNHIATAVDFGAENVSGDAITHKGRKYVICDPTFINAPVGMAMPNYKGVAPTVVK